MRNLTCCFFLLAMVLSGCEKRAADRISGPPDAPVSESTVNLSEVLILEKHLRDTLTAGHTQGLAFGPRSRPPRPPPQGHAPALTRSPGLGTSDSRGPRPGSGAA